MSRRVGRVLLVQLPIPPGGPVAVEGNVPLAAAYLKLFAQRQGLAGRWQIEILPTQLANILGDQGLAAEILAREPHLVGFTCYLWNIERTLWLARRLKAARPETKIVLGGPEIGPDNALLHAEPCIDYAICGEGEQAFCELLDALGQPRARRLKRPSNNVSPLPSGEGQGVRAACRKSRSYYGATSKPSCAWLPPHAPLEDLDAISSPYLAGLLGTDGPTMFLETARGCKFQCRFCYYPKGDRGQRFLSFEQVAANLDWAGEHGVEEVFLLDPTLNQRRDFAALVALLARHNPGRRFRYSAELRAEGITPTTAAALAAAGFAEVEVGLQSVDPDAQRLMGRRVDLDAFARGCRAMRDAGIRVRTDLIIGLPGDTADSVRRGIDWLVATKAHSEVQVFYLSLLPGTAFRQQAARFGLEYQPRPPYYALATPTLQTEQMAQLMAEAQAAFATEFDPLPGPRLDLPEFDRGVWRTWRIDLDRPLPRWPAHRHPAQAFTLWFRGHDLDSRAAAAAGVIRRLLDDNPHCTLQVVLEPLGPRPVLSPATIESLRAACYQTVSYLDRFYSLHPGRQLGAKRLVIVLPAAERRRLGRRWAAAVAESATIA